MPQKVDEIHSSLMEDPDFKPQVGKTKDESAWAVAWSRYKQMQKNEEALSMVGDVEEKESNSSMGPDMGATKYPMRIGAPTTWENTKKTGLHQLETQKDKTKRVTDAPKTASARTHKIIHDGRQNITEKAIGSEFAPLPPESIHQALFKSLGKAYIPGPPTPQSPPPYPGAQWNPMTRRWRKPRVGGKPFRPWEQTAQRKSIEKEVLEKSPAIIEMKSKLRNQLAFGEGEVSEFYRGVTKLADILKERPENIIRDLRSQAKELITDDSINKFLSFMAKHLDKGGPGSGRKSDSTKSIISTERQNANLFHVVDRMKERPATTTDLKYTSRYRVPGADELNDLRNMEKKDWKKPFKTIGEAFKPSPKTIAETSMDATRQQLGYKMAKEVKEPFAVATAQAQQMGYTDFSPGTPGQRKRDEIAETLKSGDFLDKLLFTTRRGKVKSSSKPQHRLLHGRKLPHTHIEGDEYKREGQSFFRNKSLDKLDSYLEREGVRKPKPQEMAGYAEATPSAALGRADKVMAMEKKKIDKGGPGSGRRPKGGIPRNIRTAIGEYYRDRTPSTHQGVVEAFRQREGARRKRQPETLIHPLDK